MRLDLDLQNFENQCHSFNKLLIKNGLFLKVSKLKEKLSCLIKQNSEIKTLLRKLSSCVIEKFNGFSIACVEFSKKLRQPFRPIDIIYKPVNKCDDIADCFFFFFREKLNPAYRTLYSKAKESNVVLHDNVIFARIITLDKINLIAMLKIAQVVWTTFIILTCKIY